MVATATEITSAPRPRNADAAQVPKEMQQVQGRVAQPLALPYPANPIVKAFLHGPVLLWRLGLGRLVGRSLIVLTTWGRKTGLPRHTAIESQQYKGRKYVCAAHGPQSDWYRNIEADPHVTIQTATKTMPMRARRVVGDAEMGEAYEFLSHSPLMRRWTSLLGMQLSREQFIAEKERFYLLTFAPTTEATPPPLAPDLWWVWPLIEASMALGWLLGRRGGKAHQQRKE